MFLQQLGAGLEHLAAADLESIGLEPLDDFANQTAGHTIGLQQNERRIHARGIVAAAEPAKSRISRLA